MVVSLFVIPGLSNALSCPAQVIMLSTVTELHAYIDPAQLTVELGGTQEYCHEKWISHRTVSVPAVGARHAHLQLSQLTVSTHAEHPE